MQENFPQMVHLVPSADNISLAKLGDAGIISDTCNAAQKVRRILAEGLESVFEFDCMHHLRNVWFGGMERALTKKLNTILRDSLDEIDPTLRVTASITAIIRAIDKEFSLSANYPKGHGDLFLEWMREHHEGELLLHVERAAGSRQDLCTEGSLAIFMNYPYYVEFLDEALRKKRTKVESTSILRRNLFVVLTSAEMIALSRLLSIIHLAICMPFRWLAGKTHELRQYNWGPMSMARVLDTLDKAMTEIKADPQKILDEDYMMTLFDEYASELPPFKEYLTLMYEKRSSSVVARKSSAKIVTLKHVRRTLFHPKKKTDRKSSRRVRELAAVAAEAIQTELHDENKATRKYLSGSGSDYSWPNCSEERKQALLGTKATNCEAESTLGGATANVQRYGRIGLHNAGAVSAMNRNGFLDRGSKSKTKKQSRGLFHGLSPELQHSIVLVAMQDAPATNAANAEALTIQAAAKRRREELLKEKNMSQCTERFIEALYYHRMYNSPACWKGDPRIVDRELKK